MFKTIYTSIKYQLRELSARHSIFLSKLYFWQWKRMTFQLNSANDGLVQYIGSPRDLPVLKSLLGVGDTGALKSEGAGINVSVYDFPVPNALRIPHCLSTLVTLDKPIEDILAGYSRSLRRSTLKLASQFRYEQVTTKALIHEIDKTMLRPYAIARNGVGANHLPMRTIKGLALSHYGRLDLLYEEDKALGCHLGNAYMRRGKRYWNVNRFGYIDEVFTNYTRLQDVNSANLHLALLYAIENGYDYCDYGVSLARPGNGLIEWKRRRKGYLAKATTEKFYLKIPKKGAAQFFWSSPLFSLEGKKINLNLGVPTNKTDQEMQARYREMGYDGLTKVYLMCETQPSEVFIEMIRNLYKELRFQPDIIVTITT